MFYWKYINLPSAEIKFIQHEYKKKLPNNNYFFQSLELTCKEFLGLEVQRFVLIQVEPNAVGRIHTDYRPLDYGHQLAIQIPLENCHDSVTKMWESDYEPPLQYTTNGQPYNYFDDRRCKKVTEFKLLSPVIWRTDIPHSVDNFSNFVRKSISIRFKSDPWHLIENSNE